MKIGFDFDNTIVCYDRAIEILSDKLQLPQQIKNDKLSIRNYLINQNRENEWTEFQGTLYGPGIAHAKPYKYFIEISKNLKLHQHELFIVSHRTKYPYAGQKHDLHKYASEWLEEQFISKKIIECRNIYFLNTLEKKIRKIEELKIELFVDDLIEVFNHENFPSFTKAVLFSPDRKKIKKFETISTWNELIYHV